MRPVTEVLEMTRIPLWRHPEWRDRFPWLEQGVTGNATADSPLDFGLYGEVPVGTTMQLWRQLRHATGMRTTVHARQVHGGDVAVWRDPLPPGFLLIEAVDGHVTSTPGSLLTVTVADCVPIYLVSEQPRAVAVIHAGWRGVAASILARAVGEAVEALGVDASALWLHCGPSICGACYEVGPEVHAAVNPGTPAPDRNLPIDLPAAIAERAGALGLDPARMTRSTHCTLCGTGGFFSHRGGSPARQVCLAGIRP